MAIDTFPSPREGAHRESPLPEALRRRPTLERSIEGSWINLEVIAYLAIVALSVLAHVWGLDAMAMHHDESIHAWSSWRFYTGAGGFECANGFTAPTYCYDPVYHGPSLYVLTLFSYFLFGDGDAQARLPMAMAGIGLVASSWWLRPYLGRRGALAAALLLGFAPSLLYYTRFARHDGLMVLWELWMVIGVFRYLDSGQGRWLYLMSIGLALAIATHELYYILLFIFGLFALVRLLSELRLNRWLYIGLPALLLAMILLMIFNPPLPIGQGLYLGEKAFLVGSALLLIWPILALWDPHPLVIERFKRLWLEDRTTLWIALAILAGIYLVLYTTFFAYPRGALDGLYAGLAYWLGSQQEYARGDQPWYYYLMQLPLYEPLGVAAGLGMLGYLAVAVGPIAWRRARSFVMARSRGEATPDASVDNMLNDSNGGQSKTDAAAQTDHPAPFTPIELFPLLLVFWYVTAIIIFSWAGEKMPWLVVHMALPGNLLAAWVIGRLLRVASARWHTDKETESEKPSAGVGASPRLQMGFVPLAVVLMLVALGVAIWRLTIPAEGQEAQQHLLQGLVPLILAGALLYWLLNAALRFSTRVVLSLAGLTLAALLGAYMIRATWMAVYEHPDVPVELLVYTQSAPDVPRYVTDIRELAINLTRNQRTPDDATGGLSMPIILDSGDSNNGGAGSLAWPFQWYLRDFKKLEWKDAAEFRDDPDLANFEVQFADDSIGLAPAIVLAKNHVTPAVRNVLQERYVQPYGDTGVFNWWFPEGNKCAPGELNYGYKRFYYNTWTPIEKLTVESGSAGSGGCGADISASLESPLAPILWPFQRENQSTLWDFVLYRNLPSSLAPGARQMEFWLRDDLVSGAPSNTVSSAPSGAAIPLMADQVIGAPGELNGPTGVVVDGRGTIYVADTMNHRIQVFDAQGNRIRTLGGFGGGLQQFYEPRGLAVDADDNLYVADTWNARISKFSPEGEWLASWGSGASDLGDGRMATITNGDQFANESQPLGFFGPRDVAVDAQGNVYIADTGNKRIVVTDAEGNYRYQWGYGGSDLGEFNEPSGVAVDADGYVYVADTWNSRVQVFPPQPDGIVAPVPSVHWRVSGWLKDTYEDPAIEVDNQGHVFVGVPLQNIVIMTNTRGDVLLRWGGAGSDLASLNSPSGMAIDPEGDIVVADRNSSRALRFTLPNLRS